MEKLIRQAFLHVDVIGPHVHDGHYDLIGPDSQIILPQVWETMVQPDWAVTMHLWPMPEPPSPPLPPSDFMPLPPHDPVTFLSSLPPWHVTQPLPKTKTKTKKLENKIPVISFPTSLAPDSTTSLSARSRSPSPPPPPPVKQLHNSSTSTPSKRQRRRKPPVSTSKIGAMPNRQGPKRYGKQEFSSKFEPTLSDNYSETYLSP